MINNFFFAFVKILIRY